MLIVAAGVVLSFPGVGVLARTADETPEITAVAWTFVPAETTVAEGSSVTFVNADPVPHDVTSIESGPDGAPLFRSNTIRLGSADVVGAEDLAPGSYSFYCSVHDGMTGLLTVA